MAAIGLIFSIISLFITLAAQAQDNYISPSWGITKDMTSTNIYLGHKFFWVSTETGIQFASNKNTHRTQVLSGIKIPLWHTNIKTGIILNKNKTITSYYGLGLEVPWIKKHLNAFMEFTNPDSQAEIGLKVFF